MHAASEYVLHKLFWWWNFWNLETEAHFTLSMSNSNGDFALASTTNWTVIGYSNTQSHKLSYSALPLSVTLSLKAIYQYSLSVHVTDYTHSHERKLGCPYEEQMRKTRTHTSKHTTGSNQTNVLHLYWGKRGSVCDFSVCPVWVLLPYSYMYTEWLLQVTPPEMLYIYI